MASDAGKFRVLIPTTRGPVEVLLLTVEDPAIGRCVACIGGTTETADIASAYHAFVVRPTGVIESRFGHSCYRLDVSGRIDAGSSWQLAVLAAHALYAAGRLAGEKDTAAGVLWATGSVRPIDLTVGAVNHVAEKLESSIDRLRQEAAAGRRVLLALPAPNADDLPPPLARELSAHGIEVVALSHVEPLFGRLAMVLPDAPQKRAANDVVAHKLAAARRRRYVWGGLAAAIFCVAAGAAVLFERQAAPDVAPKMASVSGEPAENTQPVERPLAAELVPFISEREKIAIRDVYMPAPPYKALAIGREVIGFVTGQPSQKIADEAAVEACTNRTNRHRETRGLQPLHVCEVYASGDVVVTKRGLTPMPPTPWLIRDPSVERPFVAADLPLVSTALKEDGQRYLSLPKSKAYVLGPRGGRVHFSRQKSQEEAMRRALERCGYESGVPCMVIAVDDSFVVPIPVTAKVVGFYRPTALTAVPSSLRDDIARRLANATSGWNAVAVGAGGHAGLKLGAPSERAAVDASLEACRTQDRDCRVAVLGPFLVEGEPERAATP